MGLLHNLGQVAGHGLNALPGYSTLGSQITNPNVNYHGVLNPPTPSNNYYSPSTAGSPRNETTTKDTGALPTGPYTGSGGDGSAPAAGDLAYLDSSAQTLRDLLGRSQSTLDQGLTNLNDSFNREPGTANQARSRALENFDIQSQDNTRKKEGALGTVDTNARTLNDSLRRILGMASGSGSTAYQLAAPNAVARQASTQRTGVLGDYGENDRNIGLASKRATEDFASLLDDLSRQRGQKEQELRTGVLQNEQDVNSQLANVEAQKQSLLGGGYDAARAAQRPYQDAINSRQTQIDSLFNQFRNPVLTAKQVDVQTPDLKDYTVDRAAINAQSQGGGQYSPYDYLLNKKKDEQLV